MKLSLSVISLLLLLRLSAYGQDNERSLLLDEAFITDAQEAIDSVYNMNYPASLEILQPWREAHPDHPVWLFWPALAGWWQILPDLESTDHDRDFFRQLEEAIAYSKQKIRHSRNVDALIVQSMSYGLLARHYSNRGRWYTSLQHARQAMNHFSEVEKIYPDLPDIQFGLGMARYFSAFIVEAYPVVRPFAWLLPRGDKEDGLERLAVAADQSTFMIPEATFFLGHIYLHYERSFNEARDFLEELTQRYPENGYYHRLLIRSHFRNFNFTTALSLTEQTLAKWEHKEETVDDALREELFTIRGRINYRRGEYDAAEEAFKDALRYENSLSPAGERRQQVIANYYMGEISLIRAERDLAREYLEKAAASKLDYRYVDRAKSVLRREFR